MECREKYQDDSITDDANDATKLRQALFRAKKRNIRTPYKRTNRFFIGQDLQGFSGYQNKYADIHSKVVFFYFDDRSVEYIFELYHMKWGLYDNKLIADCNKYELGIFIPDAGIQTHDQ